MQEDNNRIIEILWTGGFDSTFRIVQLSRMSVTIQPYYLIFDTRKTTDQELSAISNISNILNERVETKCKLLPLITVKVSAIKISEDIKEAYKEIRKNTFLGDQYLPIAEFAKSHKGIEIGVLYNDNESSKASIFGKYIKVNDNVLGVNYKIDKTKISDSVYTLFKDATFPLQRLSKAQLKELFIQWGYKDIMDLTWFCHYPIKNRPCGFCNPCAQTIEKGLSERFTKIALCRYYYIYIKKKIHPIKQKIYTYVKSTSILK